jgi:hypothetical protein
VARRAELPIGSRLRELAQKIFIHVPLEIVLFMGREIHLSDKLNDRAQCRPVVNLECGIPEEELSGRRKSRELVEFLDCTTESVEEFVASHAPSGSLRISSHVVDQN